MAILQHISMLALRHVVDGARDYLGLGVGERTVENVVGFLNQHFTDHSQSLSRAMVKANDSAWKALEIALAGESLWNWLDSADNKAFRQQVRAFLDAAPLAGLAGHGPEYRQACLKELRHARKQGLLSGALEPRQLAEQVGQFARFSDTERVLAAEWQAITALAEECSQCGCGTLAHLLALRPQGSNDAPLLVIAVRFFFRREIETDQQLYQGLSWAKFELMQLTQEQAFQALTEVLSNHADKVESMLASVQVVVVQTHQAVLDIQSEVSQLAKRFDLLHRELRPRDSLSIGNDTERQLVKQLVKRYRALPESERQQFPALLNSIGKLEVAAGAFAEAQHDFQQAATLTHDRAAQAEAHFNRFGVALETSDFGAALQALRQAADLQPDRYALFPAKKYEPERILGAGGFGVAILCRNKLTSSRVVVKALRTDTLARDLSDVFREAQVLEELDHPAIIRLRDCDYADAQMSRPYLVMDYFEGETLEKHVADKGTLSIRELIALLRPVAEALQVAHDRGILHRDVKPGNLLVRRDGEGQRTWRVKLIDFGLALKQDVLHGSVAGASAGSCTVIGYSIAGTLDYAAPEQLGKLPGVAPGPYTDIYGLARTCCYALFKTTQPLRKHWRDIPEALADLLEQCLNEAPGERVQSCRQLLAILDQMCEDTPPAPSPDKQELWKPAREDVQQQRLPFTDERAAPRQHKWWAVTDTTASDARRIVRRLTGHSDAVLSLSFSADGRYLLSGSADHTVRLWDVQSGQEVKRLPGHTDKVWSVLFLGDSGIAASAGKDKSVRYWDVERGQEQRCLAARTNRVLALSPDCQLGATGNVSDGMIRLWEVKSGRELRRLKGHMSWVLSLAFEPETGRQLLSGSADGSVRLWDVNSGRELQRLTGHTDQVWSVAFSPSGRSALSASADKTVRLWDLRAGRELKCYAPFKEEVWSVAFAPVGKMAACGSDGGSLRVWSFETSLAPPPFQGHTAKVMSVAFSPDGRLLASAGQDKTIVLWDVAG